MGSSRTPSKPTACALVAVILFVAPTSGRAGTPDDPLEPFNRGMYAIHRGLDLLIFGPAARAYQAVLPAPLRKGLRNLINNLKEPGIAFNDLLQAHPARAVKTSARFVINSVAGVGGLFDIAYNAGLPHHDNGFGATAGLAVGHRRIDDVIDVLRLGDLAQMLDHPMHFVVGDKRAVHPGRQPGAGRQIEHVALAEQGFGPHLVEDGAGIDLR